MDEINYADKHVLLIESSGNMRATIFYMLRGLGVENIKSITINRNVITEIADGDYDVILLGHNDSDSLTGIELLEECRHLGYIKPSACWIFMTSDASQEVVLHAIDSAPDDLLMKPFSVEELKSRLDENLYRKSAFKEVDDALAIGDLVGAIEFCKSNFSVTDELYDESQTVLAELLIKTNSASEAEVIAERQYWKNHDKAVGIIWAKAMLAQNKFEKTNSLLDDLIKEYPLFIAAYDLIAELRKKSGDFIGAREVLEEATRRNPMGIPRQMALGELATETKQFDLAGSAYKKSILLGRHSCHKSADPYLKLANVHRLEMSAAPENVSRELRSVFENTLAQAQQEFPNDKVLQVKSSLLKSEMFKDKGMTDEAESCQKQAEEINKNLDEPINLGQALQDITSSTLVEVKPEESKQQQVPVSSKYNPEMSVKANGMGVKNYLSGNFSQALKYFGMATEYDFGNAKALLNLAQVFLESARDSKDKRDERLKMVKRYLRLSQRLPLEGEAEQKQQQLLDFMEHDILLIPDGSLGNLLR